jgi:hypothetical protein
MGAKQRTVLTLANLIEDEILAQPAVYLTGSVDRDLSVDNIWQGPTQFDACLKKLGFSTSKGNCIWQALNVSPSTRRNTDATVARRRLRILQALTAHAALSFTDGNAAKVLQPWIQLAARMATLLETALGRMDQIRKQQQTKAGDIALEPEAGFEKWLLERRGHGRAITRLSALIESAIAPATLKENKDWFWAALHDPGQAANLLINNNIHELLCWAPVNPAQTGRILAALDGAWARKHAITVTLLVKYTTPHALARAEDILDVWSSPTLKPRSAAHVSEILFLTDTVRVLRDEGKGYKIEEEHIAIVTLAPGLNEEPQG